MPGQEEQQQSSATATAASKNEEVKAKTPSPPAVIEEEDEEPSSSAPAATTSAAASSSAPVSAPPTAVCAAWHGYCGDPSWKFPKCVVKSTEVARPGYSKMSASEYCDAPDVLAEKVNLLVSMIKKSAEFTVYTGAGLSTAAGVGDYASKAKGSVVQREGNINRLQLQPTLSHRVLASLEKEGHLKYWLQQNHDGLAQKAGYPFEKINEIHGSWFDKKNPVVFMDGQLRKDLFAEMMNQAKTADLVLAVGTSMCGMTSDCVAAGASERHIQSGAGQGLVIVNLQQTPYDEACSLRIFAKIDDVMSLVKKKMKLKVDTATYSAYPPVMKPKRSTPPPAHSS